MTWAAWTLIGISAAGGIAIKVWALPFPIAYAVALYIADNSEGAFVNHSHSGDNLAALSLFSTALWCVLGLLVVSGGIVTRVVASSILRARRRNHIPSPH